MPTPSWRTDTSRHPLVIVHLVGGDGSEQPDPQSLIRIVDGLIEKRERVVVVYDLTGSKPDAKRRQLLVHWLSENAEKLARYVVASGIVAPTPFHRGLLIATFFLVRKAKGAGRALWRPRERRWLGYRQGKGRGPGLAETVSGLLRLPSARLHSGDLFGDRYRRGGVDPSPIDGDEGKQVS